MPNFHRLTVPSYSGGLPGGYDYINNATSGTPAPANGILVGGPNVGSYFVGFGDDGTSANANRAAAALAANTDFLDNLLRRDIALPVVSGTAAGGPGATSIVLPVATYLGNGGTTNTPSGLKPYFHITDDLDNDIIDASGFPVVVASLTLTVPDVIGVGFSVNTVTAVFSEAIPTGRNYRVYYSTRGNLATLPPDAFTVIRIRGAQEVPQETEALFQLLHGNGQAWDAPWTSTIWDLAGSGLNERYDRSTTRNGVVPVGWPIAINTDTIASGAWYKRTGPGITGYSNWNLTGATGIVTNEGWMSGALFAALDQDFGIVLTGLTKYTRVGGDTTGFFYLGHQRFTQNGSESNTGAAPGNAAFFYGAAVETPGTPDTNFYTWMVPGTTLTFNADDTATIGGGWFALAGTPLQTAIAVGYDLIELDFGNGQKRQLVITGINTTTNATFANRDGSNPNVNGQVANIVRWVRFLGGTFENAPLLRQNIFGDNGQVLGYGTIFAYPPDMSSFAPDKLNATSDPNFQVLALYGPDQNFGSVILAWGGYDSTLGSFTYAQNGYLFADGSIFSRGNIGIHGTGVNTIRGNTTISPNSWLNVNGSFAQAGRFQTPVGTFTSTGSPFTLNFLTEAALAIITPTGSGVLTVNVTNCSTPFTTEFWFSVHQTASNYTSVAVTCDAGITVHFEAGTLDSSLSTATATDVYRGRIIGTHCYMSVQRFPGV